MQVLDWLSHGLWDLSPWALVGITLVLTHLTVLAVTLYLHRYSAHRALWLHPILQHFFRLWLWLATGMNTKEWTAVHRKHHAHCETEEDPHSPVVQGINAILWRQVDAYRVAAADPEVLERYGSGTPDDWLERNVYKYTNTGATLMLFIDIALFGVIGITIWAIQMLWIPLLGGVINGIGHYWGYRNFECPDASRNVLPVGLLIGGEELHNNHHTYANSAKFSTQWWEFDLGWAYIKLFSALGLARPLSTGPVALQGDAGALDKDTAAALINDRFNVMATFAREVVAPVVREQRKHASGATAKQLKRAQKILCREASLLDEAARERLSHLVQLPELKTIYDLRLELQAIWERRTGDLEEVVSALKAWCAKAESSSDEHLQAFVARLRSYRMPLAAA